MIPSIRDPAYVGALIFFDRAAARLSFAQAAADLGVTASAVSHRIAALEAALGKRLFERDIRAVRLTAEGAELAAVTARLLASLEEATDRLAERPVLRVSVGPFLSATWLMPRLARFEAAVPGLRVDLHHVIGPVDLRSVDVALLWAARHPTRSDARPLMQTDYIAVAQPELAGRGAIWDSGQAPIHYRDRSAWRHWLGVAGLDPAFAERGMVLNDPILVLEAAAHGRGVALGTMPFVAGRLASGLLVQAHPASVPSDKTVWVAVSEPENRLARRFESWLIEEAARGDAAVGGKE
jgi:LysR family glycine cleavage system transcriptional activator